MSDPYKTLGVARDADADTIRKAFKKLARKYHPDVNQKPGAEQRFKEVNAANSILGDPEKRKAWDEFGEASTRPGFDADRARQYRSAGMGGGGGFPGGGFGGAGDVDDLLSSLFGGGAGRRRPRKGADQRARLTIDLLTAIRGGEREISVGRHGGQTENLKVRVPAGAKDGSRLRLRGQGAPPPGGGPCGDLHLEIHVDPHPVLRRVNDDLEMDVPLTILEAMKGTKVTVPTPTGDVSVRIPAGVTPGQRLRLKGRGIQKAGSPTHLYLVLQPTPPKSDDPDVLAAAQRLEEAYVGDLRGHIRL